MFLIIKILLMSISIASAQQTPLTPHDQAMGQRLLEEINRDIACQTARISLQSELDKAINRIKELETKYEPKKDDLHSDAQGR